MAEPEEIKREIEDRIHDPELASSVWYEVEAYSKRWPFVFLINDRDVWNESKNALRLQVVRWLEANCTPYDFYQFRTGWGLVGFKSQEAANRFETRWSEQSVDLSVSHEDWNPHPQKSTSEPIHVIHASRRDHLARRVIR